MKKLFLTLAIALAGSFAASAANDYYRDTNNLPQAAKIFLDKNFKHSEVSFVKVEKNFGRIDEYEVVLQDGTEVSFDRNGNWDNVEMPVKKSVPGEIVPPEIARYVGQNYPKQRIVSIDKESGGYEVELSDGLDLKFNKAGQFKRIDD